MPRSKTAWYAWLSPGTSQPDAKRCELNQINTYQVLQLLVLNCLMLLWLCSKVTKVVWLGRAPEVIIPLYKNVALIMFTKVDIWSFFGFGFKAAKNNKINKNGYRVEEQMLLASQEMWYWSCLYYYSVEDRCNINTITWNVTLIMFVELNYLCGLEEISNVLIITRNVALIMYKLVLKKSATLIPWHKMSHWSCL